MAVCLPEAILVLVTAALEVEKTTLIPNILGVAVNSSGG